MAITEEELEALRSQHGEVTHLVYQGEDVVLRKPKAPEYRRFRSLSFNEKKRDIALETLVRDVMVLPPRDKVDAFFERFPAVGEAVGSEALKLAGLVDADLQK